ncbi:MAG: NUDIX domain-containing protein [bacterium]|nr:NUDIX domain-containing protein [bacterium]
MADHDIPLDEWGTGEANTITALMGQLESGEVALLEGEQGELIRHSEAAGIIVLHHGDDGHLYRLNERQVFDDGRVRSRNFPGSIGEKIRHGESAEEAARRALVEELGLSPELAADTEVRLHKKLRRDRHSQSFPGMISRGSLMLYVVEFDGRHYRPCYVERQEGKTNHFEWSIVQNRETYDASYHGMTGVQ